jgi:hypothetical protein
MQHAIHRNALEFLRHDHRRLKDLFESFSESDNLSEQGEVLDSLFRELRWHARVELEIFFPALESAGPLRHLADQAEEEHQEIAAAVDDLQRMEPRAPLFSDKFVEMEDKVLNHIDQQETELFIQVDDWGLDVDELGSEMQNLRSEMMRREPAAAVRPAPPARPSRRAKR